MDHEGNKINDPIFESYCRQNCLSIEKSAVEVPLRLIARPVASEPTPYTMQVAEQFLTDASGNIIQSTVKHQKQHQPSENQNPIGEMSIEQAVKLGLIRPPGRMVEDDKSAPEETATGMATGVPKSLAAPGLAMATPEIGKPVETDAALAMKAALEAHGVTPAAVKPVVVEAQPIITKLAPSQLTQEPTVVVKPEVVKPARRRGHKEKAPVATEAPVAVDSIYLPDAKV